MTAALKKRLSPLLPLFVALAFAAIPALFFYVNNMPEVRVTAFVYILAISLVGGLVFLGLNWLIFREWRRAAVFTAPLATFFFYYEAFFSRFVRIAPAEPLERHTPFLVLAALAFGLFAVLLRRARRRSVTLLLNYLAVVGLVLILINLYNAGLHEWRNRGVSVQVENSDAREAVSSGRIAEKPDIYYLVFDRYTGQEALRESYGFDNSDMVDFLRSKGFYVADSSYANYPVTTSSLTSSLNMGYHRVEGNVERATSRRPLYKLFGHPEAARFLKSQGYEFVQVGSWWGPTQKSPEADRNPQYAWRIVLLGREFHLRNFVGLFVRGTLIRPILDQKVEIAGLRVTDWSGFGKHGQIFLDQVEDVKRMPAEDGRPRFVFAHFLMPHAPYVFNPEGGPTEPGENPFLQQLQFTNKKIKELVEALQGNERGRSSVVIISSDEGEFPPNATATGSDAEVRQKLNIINSFYFPDGDHSALSHTVTPVNTFRVVFNKYFGTGLPLLPDRSYTFRSSAKLLMDWTDVTERVRGR